MTATAPPIGRRERRLLEVRNSLLAAGRDLLAEGGADACTIEAIAESADVATATFYNHFGSKEDFLVDVVLSVRGRLIDAAMGILLATENPHHELALVVRQRIEAALADEGTTQTMLSLDDAVFVEPGPIGDLFRRAIVRGVDLGIFTEMVDPELAAVMFRGVIRGACRHVAGVAPECSWKAVAYSALRMLGASTEDIVEAVTAAAAAELPVSIGESGSP